MTKSYVDLEIYKIAMELFIETHHLTLRLPKFELYELGSQIRRSSESIVTNIVEGYGRRKYKQEFIKFLIYSEASNAETKCHFEKLIRLYPDLSSEAITLLRKYDQLGGMIFKFKQYVQKNWLTDIR
jgi:four helix bundle protein